MPYSVGHAPILCSATLKERFAATSVLNRIRRLLPKVNTTFQLMRALAGLRNGTKEIIAWRRNQSFGKEEEQPPNTKIFSLNIYKKNNDFRSKFNFKSIMISVLNNIIITIKRYNIYNHYNNNNNNSNYHISLKYYYKSLQS